jgi:O-antigen/teichoic acid export membrane protein
MRKRYRVLFFAALVAALIVPVGYALSIDSKPKAARTRYTVVVPAAAVVAAPVMMPRVGDAVPGSVMHTLSDSAKLLCVGTVLFGLAAAVRKVN